MAEKTPATLDRLWDDIDAGNAPIGDLLAAGHAAKRRKRRAVLAGAAAATALVLGGSAIAVQSSGGPDRSGLVADGGSNGADASTRLVGIGQVAIAVPSDWADSADSCNAPFKDTVFFAQPRDCTAARSHVASSLIITSREFTDPDDLTLNDSRLITRLDGHNVVDNGPDCSLGYAGPTNESTYCTQTFAIPDLHAYFTALIIGDNAETRLADIRNSLAVLPDTQTTVPFVTQGAPLSGARAAMDEAGLAVRVNQVICGPAGYCMSGVVGVTPAPGSIVSRGTTITLDAY